MNKFVFYVLIISSFFGSFFSPAYAVIEEVKEAISSEVKYYPENKKRMPLYQYGYQEREHSLEESMKNLSIVYGMTWFFYPIVQPKVFRGEGGFKTYKRNLGKLVFDQDEPFWNDFIHPLSGSQLYLLYRADGYDRISAFEMTFISSALFEFTVEIFTEPASVQDLYQTPVLGSVLGYGIEGLSMYLLNTGNTIGLILGHALNPATLLPIYEGRTLIIPKLDDADKGAMIKWEYQF